MSGGSELLDCREHLVPLVRDWLRRGVSDSNLASAVRIRELRPLGGGLKADVVGMVSVEVQAVAKVGAEELVRHELLMTAANRRNALVRGSRRLLQAQLFPEVMLVRPLARAEPRGRQLMLMQGLVGYTSLEDELYRGRTGEEHLWRMLRTALAMLAVVHELRPEDEPGLERLARTPEPFAPRLRERLAVVVANDPALAPLWSRSGQVDGVELPPLEEALARAEDWLAAHPPARLELVHGDCHLGNVMGRRRGRAGRSIRLIDPNPEIGFTDPAYDAGKLMHLLDAVGWVRHAPERCRARWSARGRTWKLESEWTGGARGREAVRARLAERLIRQLGRDGAGDDAWRARLHVATAAAHVGLAALLDAPSQKAQRRFVLAHTLAELGRFLRATEGVA